MDNNKNKPYTDKTKRFNPYQSPFRIFAIMALSIFAVEFLVMVILIFLPHRSPVVHALVDSTMLLLLLSPMLYFFLFLPLLRLTDELKAYGKELKAERDKMQRYLDITGVMITVLDSSGRVTLINRKGCELLGYEEKDILGRDWFENFIPARMKEEVKLVFSDLISGRAEGGGYFENPVLTKSGEERIVLWHNVLLKEDGRVTGSLSSGEDVTERKRMEKALKESERKYRLIHNTVFDGIIISDTNDVIVDTNPSAEKMFGYGKGELIGKDLTLLMPESYRARHKEGVRAFMETGVGKIQGKIVEVEGLKKDGTVLPIELIVSTFSLAGVLNFTGTIRDITERKRSETEKEIIQTRLSQSQKMEAIGRFAGGIAHDFNNILTAIRGNAELALEGLDKTDPLFSRLDGIVLSVMHASKLTRQLLLFSKGQPFELVPLNINNTIENMLKMVSRIISENIKISTDLWPELWLVKADEGNIEQVIMNLAINAKDAMPSGGTLFIKTGNVTLTEEECLGLPDAHPGRSVCLTVADTGTGIKKELLQHIFEPFFTTKEAGKGMGFGLAMVYGVIKQHGGWITVNSELDRGTVFKVYLPAIEEKAGEEKKAPAKKLYGMGERVLLVEDEGDIREFAGTALSENGYIVLTATTAAEAFDALEKENWNVDLVISDVVLPDKSGFQMSDEILTRKPGLQILLTGSFMDVKAGISSVDGRKFRYLQKPYSLTGLLLAVASSLEKIRIKR